MAVNSHSDLKDLHIFELRPLITNFSCKLSAVTVSPYDEKQFLCLVSEENDIVLRYINNAGQEVFKMISWFRRSNRVIHDVCFDPAGTWLLVLCFDNTLHILPALSLVDRTHNLAASSLYSMTQITSYIIPFVGPHECPNSKLCPNHSTMLSETLEEQADQMADNLEHIRLDKEADNIEAEALGQDLPDYMLANGPEAAATAEHEHMADATGNSQVMASSFMASKTCPYPLSVVWWKTYQGLNRAIIGYSDGSICFVGLSPNCPMIASTTIQSGSVVRLTICKDNTFDGVMLLITSSLKEQFKLLLEQKAISYVYPGDSSPTTREGAWQIVMSVHAKQQTGVSNEARQSNSSDPASDSSQLDEDVFAPAGSEDVAPTTQTATVVATTPELLAADSEDNACTPAAPPAVSENAGMRFQQQQLGVNSFDGILPATRARLASLKSLGSKKLQAIKMRLSDQRQKFDEFMPDNHMGSFAIMDSPSVTPEPLGNTNGSHYTIQNLRSTYLLSALHSSSCSLTVHSIDINLKPLFLYKIPKHCVDILISSNILYSIQYVNLNSGNDTASSTATAPSSLEEPLLANTEKESLDADSEKVEANTTNKSDDTSATTSASSMDHSDMPSNAINAVSIISSAMASQHATEDNKFNQQAQLALFRFEHETVLHLYQMAQFRADNNGTVQLEALSKEEKAKAFELKDIHTPMDYVQFYESVDVSSEYSLRQMEIMQAEFPKINYDPCYVITNKNVYTIQLKKAPFELFLDAALISEWNQCRDFCNTFDLSFEHCIEFAGDYLLRRKKITQALITYNVARVKPIRTALKLAMYGHTFPLMQLCAMALKCSYILRTRYFCHTLLKGLLPDITYRHSEDVREILPLIEKDKSAVVNSGESCSDYLYGVDESISALQMSPSSQFHLANLLLITLAEKAVNDKNYLPLWNFLVTNSKYHTNMTSIVLCQSGLFSAAVILAKMRGVCLDTFNALVSVVAQEFGWYNELNVCLYNLSECLFMETITYLPYVAMEFFCFIQNKLEHIRPCVLQFAIESSRFKPISAGCAYGACVVDGVAYFWGSSGVPLCYSAQKSTEPPEPAYAVKTLELLSQLNLEVHAIKCGRQHTLILTNNGLYAMGNNNLCQLGIGQHMQMALQPMLLTALDGMNITMLEAGQYHNAAVADGKLYMWGWGIYGQLGNGSPENLATPTLVSFFKYKKILQISLGHAHSLVLCQVQRNNYTPATNDSVNELYVFGSNHFGQLGIGCDEQGQTESKTSLPLRLELSDCSIRLIHTKFFTNLAVDEQERMYTWGSSPQALRLANQIKRRANAKQKQEEMQQREMLSKRLEETLLPPANNHSNLVEPSTSYAAVLAGAVPKSNAETKDNPLDSAKSDASDVINATLTANIAASASVAVQTMQPSEPDPSEHMTPHLVDTSEVAGQILQISSGLFHYALISSTCTLYTWGKNLEHQLGTEDKDRRTVLKPSPIDSIERPMYVDCGADFTLVMTTDHVVKAFGGNSNGQCGRDLGASLDRMRQRVVCLPTTKRLMRFESQCVEAPVEINLPRPRIRLDQEPVRYLKVMPPYQPHFLQQANISFDQGYAATPNYKSSSDQAGTGQDSDDLLSSLENLSHNDGSYSYNIAQPGGDANSSLDMDYSPEEQSYVQLPNQTPAATATANVAAALLGEDDDISSCTRSSEATDVAAMQPLRHYIHYCLYAFHGLYNPDKISECARVHRNEYRIRICMLNFRFVEAFQLCLHSCDTAQRTLKLFEYFSKDTGYVPLKRPDLKHLIYHMCLHFMERKFDMLDCERFFMSDLDYYLLELAYVFYFNNNNSTLEQNLNQKFKLLIAATDSNQSDTQALLQDTDAIFDSFSVKFKTLLCQRLLSYCESDANASN
ncbi:ca [Drosophila busckii]|uniref:Ca n=1 Tax=Drosophila busckii TaxID=30019 RepID=A0A0M4EJ88_DROBS|nr:ca [Drosophila busckii]